VYANIRDGIVKAHISRNANRGEVEGGQACLGRDLQKQLIQKNPVLAGIGETIQNEF